MSARIQEVEKRLAKAKSSALARAVPPSFPPPAPQPATQATTAFSTLPQGFFHRAVPRASSGKMFKSPKEEYWGMLRADEVLGRTENYSDIQLEQIPLAIEALKRVYPQVMEQYKDTVTERIRLLQMRLNSSTSNLSVAPLPQSEALLQPTAKAIERGEKYYQTRYNPVATLEKTGGGLRVANDVHYNDTIYALQRLQRFFKQLEEKGARNYPQIQAVVQELQTAIARLEERIDIITKSPPQAITPAGDYAVQPSVDFDFLAQPRTFQNKFGFSIPIFREYDGKTTFEGKFLDPNEIVVINWISTDQQKAWFADGSGRYVFTKLIANFVPSKQINISKIRVKRGAKLYFQPDLLSVKEGVWPYNDSYNWISTEDLSDFQYFESKSDFSTEVLGFGFNVYTIKGMNDNEVRYVKKEDVTPLDDAG
jgi:hypothetical protein